MVARSLNWSSALTVTLNGERAVALAGALTVRWVAAAGVRVIVPEVPVTELVAVSVTVTVWGPAVAKLTKLVKVWVPLSPEVKV